MRNPYATPGSRDPEGNVDADYSPTGYDRYRRNPGKGETPGNTLEPIYGHAPPPAVQNGTTTSPEAVMSGGISGSTARGPAGVGGNGGFGFTNLAQYIYANPMGSGPGSGYAPTPTGMTGSDFNPGVHGYTPNGGYTPGMAGVDNALNQTYGRNTAPPSASQASGGGQPTPAPGAAPAAPEGPPVPDAPGMGGKPDPRDRTRYPNLNRYMGY